jgi:hypothetical protein
MNILAVVLASLGGVCELAGLILVALEIRARAGDSRRRV